MKWLISILFLSSLASAEVTQLSLEVRQMKKYRDPYFPGKEDWRGYAALNWDVLYWDRLFWENKTYFYGDYSQVRKIGWQYDLGLRFNSVDVFYHHRSEHDADHGSEETGRITGFPLEDSFGVKINLLK